MAKIDTNTSQVLNLLRLPLAFLIVAGHANILKFPLHSGKDIMSYNHDIIIYPVHFVSQILFAPAVPLFFMISGYLFFVGIEHYGMVQYRQKLSRRFNTLVVPYLIWNMLYMLQPLAKGIIKGENEGLLYYITSVWVCPEQFERIPLMTLATPIDPPLWFIRDLIVCMILSIFIWHLQKRKWMGVVFLIVLSVLYFSDINIQFPFPGVSVVSILFFSLGSSAAIWKVNIKDLFTGTKFYHVSFLIFSILALINLSQIDYLINPTGSGYEIKMLQDPILFKFLQLFGCCTYIGLGYYIVLHYNMSRYSLGGGISCIRKPLDAVKYFKKDYLVFMPR